MSEMNKITDETQWTAWRIGRDCKSDSCTQDEAVKRFQSFSNDEGLRSYFEAGFSGKECPDLTAPKTE